MPHEELKPCPFCNGLLGTGDDSQGHTADCYIVLLLRRDGEAAVLAHAWNRRAPLFTAEQADAMHIAVADLGDRGDNVEATVIKAMLYEGAHRVAPINDPCLNCAACEPCTLPSAVNGECPYAGLKALAKLPGSARMTTLIPEREYVVKGRPMIDLADTVMARVPGLLLSEVRDVLKVLDDIGAGVVIPTPMLTEAEAEALASAVVVLDRAHMPGYAATVRALLTRLQPVSKKD